MTEGKCCGFWPAKGGGMKALTAMVVELYIFPRRVSHVPTTTRVCQSDQQSTATVTPLAIYSIRDSFPSDSFSYPPPISLLALLPPTNSIYQCLDAEKAERYELLSLTLTSFNNAFIFSRVSERVVLNAIAKFFVTTFRVWEASFYAYGFLNVV